MAKTIEVKARMSCGLCGKTATVKVDADGYQRWANGQAPIQEALPGMSPVEREVLISGTHPECFEKMFGSFDDE